MSASDRLRFEMLSADEIGPLVPQLRALERLTTYPIEGGADRFYIDHGDDYHPFFSCMGEALFLVVFRGERVIGVGAGVGRDAVGRGGRSIRVGYVADLKLLPEERGRGVARRFFFHSLRRLITTPRFWDAQLAFGAAMQDARGDVRRSFRGRLHPGRLGGEWAMLRLWFVPVARLRALDPGDDGPAPPAPDGLDLGCVRARPIVETTTGRKDLRLESTGAPWPLFHLPRAPHEWGAGLGAMLRDAAAALPEGAIACFALDARLANAADWLASRGLHTDTRSAVVTMPLGIQGWRARRAPWVHLPTSEI
jgi:hypothetical protein